MELHGKFLNCSVFNGQIQTSCSTYRILRPSPVPYIKKESLDLRYLWDFIPRNDISRCPPCISDAKLNLRVDETFRSQISSPKRCNYQFYLSQSNNPQILLFIKCISRGFFCPRQNIFIVGLGILKLPNCMISYVILKMLILLFFISNNKF